MEKAWFATNRSKKAHATEACALREATGTFNRMADWCKEGQDPADWLKQRTNFGGNDCKKCH